jgi:hypothetical protein
MKTINNIILFVFLTLISFGLMAQTTNPDTNNAKPRTNLNESVIITTQFDPVVNEAMKLSENPSIFDTTPAVPEFQYEIINKIYPTKLAVAEIKPAKVKGEPIAKLFNGNVKAGIGTYLTPFVEGLYSETRNKTFLYSIYARHYSSHWSIKDYPKNHFANNDINLYGKKIWDKFYIDAKAYYNNSINYYYGFNNQNLKLKAEKYRTLWHNVGFKTTYASLYRNDDAFHHKLSIGVEDLFGKWTTNELNFNALLEASKRFELFNKDKQTIGLQLDYRHFVFRFDTNTFVNAPYFMPSYPIVNPSYNTAMLIIRPYFDFKISKFQLHTALSFVPTFGSETNFSILPTAIVYFPIINKKLYFEGGIEGGTERVSLNTLRMENPYISPYLDIKPTSNLKLYASLNSTFLESLGINLQAGLQNFQNHHFYTFDTLAQLNNMFNIVYDDAVRFYAKTHIEYNIVKVFSLALDAEYQTYKTEKIDFAYYKPAFITSLTLQYIVADKFIIDFIPTFKAGQKAIYKLEEKKLKPIIDINLNAEYNYSEQLSFFLRLNNLAFQRYQEYYNYPSQRFMGMIGASFSF